jgi:hypothetical protein
MSIEQGDKLIMMQHGVEQVVEAMTGESDGMVQIRNKGTYSPCPAGDLHEPWVLVDPSGKHLGTGGPIYVKPDGQTTGGKDEAKLFKNPEEAGKFRNSHTGILYLQPKRLKDS